MSLVDIIILALIAIPLGLALLPQANQRYDVSGGGIDWHITGNFGITEQNYIGTNDDADFIIKRWETGGNVEQHAKFKKGHNIVLGDQIDAYQFALAYAGLSTGFHTRAYNAAIAMGSFASAHNEASFAQMGDITGGQFSLTSQRVSIPLIALTDAANPTKELSITVNPIAYLITFRQTYNAIRAQVSGLSEDGSKYATWDVSFVFWQSGSGSGLLLGKTITLRYDGSGATMSVDVVADTANDRFAIMVTGPAEVVSWIGSIYDWAEQAFHD